MKHLWDLGLLFNYYKLLNHYWYKQGYRVFCNSCWWIGSDNGYDCNSDHLEWIFDKDSEYDYDCMMNVLQNLNQPFTKN
jgi:hypothetical protein